MLFKFDKLVGDQRITECADVEMSLCHPRCDLELSKKSLIVLPETGVPSIQTAHCVKVRNGTVRRANIRRAGSGRCSGRQSHIADALHGRCTTVVRAGDRMPVETVATPMRGTSRGNVVDTRDTKPQNNQVNPREQDNLGSKWLEPQWLRNSPLR